jgi:hypothetical protein
MPNNYLDIEGSSQRDLRPFANASAGLNLQSLFEKHVMFATDKQADLQKVIGNGAWTIDLNLGQMSFEPNLVFSAQLLGSFAHPTQTWRWAWDEGNVQVPASTYEQAHSLRAYGQANNVKLFTRNEDIISVEKLHEIGLIASGVFESSAYYIADDGQIAKLFTLRGPEIPKTAGFELDARIRKTVIQTILAFEFNHAVAIEAYLKAYGFVVSRGGNQLIGTKGASVHIAEFDELDRLTSLGGSNANPS